MRKQKRPTAINEDQKTGAGYGPAGPPKKVGSGPPPIPHDAPAKKSVGQIYADLPSKSSEELQKAAAAELSSKDTPRFKETLLGVAELDVG